MSWLTGVGSALSGLVGVGEKFGTTLVSSGSKAISSAPEFLGNVVARAKTLVPFPVTGSTQPASSYTPSISKTPSNPFAAITGFFKSGFVGLGANVGQNISVNVPKPTGLTGSIEALTNFFNKTTSALTATSALAQSAKSTWQTVFGGGGAVRDASTGTLPNSFGIQIPAELLNLFGGNQVPGQSPAGYLQLPAPTGALGVPAGTGISFGASVPSNLILIGLAVIVVFTLLTRKA